MAAGRERNCNNIATPTGNTRTARKDGSITGDRQRAYRERLRRRVTDATSPGMNAGAIIDQGALRKRRFLAVRN